MNQKMIFFLFLILVAYLGIHYFVFRSSLFFFKIGDSKLQGVFFAAVAFLAFSFIGSTFLVHFTDNVFARGFYLFSGVWVGLLINLFLASLVVWVFCWLVKIIGPSCDYRTAAYTMYFLAFAVSVWGVWNVYNPIVRQIDVKIEGLPDNWKGKTVVQLSDVHLGNVLRANYMEKLAKKVDGLNPEAIFLTGDIFDGVGSDLAGFITPLNHIEAPGGIYFITGNHETYLGVEKVYGALEKTKIKVLKDELVESNGINIFGISYPERGSGKDIAGVIEENKEIISKKPTILLNHAPTRIIEAGDAGVDLQLSGHTHHGQLFPLGFVTRAIFKGFDFSLHKIGKFSIYTSSGTGAWGPTMRTSTRSEIVAITLR